MNTERNLWNKILDFENLYAAWKEASRGKRYHRQTLVFGSRLEENLVKLQNELITKAYTPEPLHEFCITDPKKRLISAPAFRDRVVQHALVRIIEPGIDSSFIYDTHACRKRHGVHLAIKRLQRFSRQAAREGKFWYYKGDIKSFFPSIPHQELKEKYRTRITDPNALWLINLFIDTYRSGDRGIPIGALISQLSANLYLDSADHYIKEVLRVPRYIRYMDDFIIVMNDKEKLKSIIESVESYIVNILNLELNPKSGIGFGPSGIPFCGFRTFPTHIVIRKPVLRRGGRHLRKLARTWDGTQAGVIKIRSSITSFTGHTSHCNARRSTAAMLDRISIKRSRP